MKNELELYLHIPFCVRKCAYCDFLSSPENGETIENYVEALIREIKAYQALSLNDIVVTIFFGRRYAVCFRRKSNGANF